MDYLFTGVGPYGCMVNIMKAELGNYSFGDFHIKQVGCALKFKFSVVFVVGRITKNPVVLGKFFLLQGDDGLVFLWLNG